MIGYQEAGVSNITAAIQRIGVVDHEVLGFLQRGGIKRIGQTGEQCK